VHVAAPKRSEKFIYSKSADNILDSGKVWQILIYTAETALGNDWTSTDLRWHVSFFLLHQLLKPLEFRIQRLNHRGYELIKDKKRLRSKKSNKIRIPHERSVLIV